MKTLSILLAVLVLSAGLALAGDCGKGTTCGCDKPGTKCTCEKCTCPKCGSQCCCKPCAAKCENKDCKCPTCPNKK